MCFFVLTLTALSVAFIQVGFPDLSHSERRWPSMQNTDAVDANPIIPFLKIQVFASHLLQNEMQTLSIVSKTFCDWPYFHFQTWLFCSMSSIQKSPSPFLNNSHLPFQTQSAVISSGKASLTLYTPSPAGWVPGSCHHRHSALCCDCLSMCPHFSSEAGNVFFHRSSQGSAQCPHGPVPAQRQSEWALSGYNKSMENLHVAVEM